MPDKEDFLYENLPDDAEQAFLLLEEAFNEDCKAKLLASRRENENVTIFYVQYISKVLGAIQELGLESKFASQGVPDISDVDYSTYLNFSKDVEHYKTMLKIRSARRLGALWVETCTKIGEGVQKLEPLRQWVDSIGNLIGQAKTDETANAPRLPPGVTPKRIEPPKAPNGDLDDEIPF